MYLTEVSKGENGDNGGQIVFKDNGREFSRSENKTKHNINIQDKIIYRVPRRIKKYSTPLHIGIKL